MMRRDAMPAGMRWAIRNGRARRSRVGISRDATRSGCWRPLDAGENCRRIKTVEALLLALQSTNPKTRPRQSPAPMASAYSDPRFRKGLRGQCQTIFYRGSKTLPRLPADCTEDGMQCAGSGMALFAGLPNGLAVPVAGR